MVVEVVGNLGGQLGVFGCGSGGFGDGGRVAVASEDGMSVRLVIEDLRPGYVYEVKALSLQSTSAQPLLHDIGWYTLLTIPREGASPSEIPGGRET